MNMSSIENKTEEENKQEDIDMAGDMERTNMRKSMSISPSKSVIERTMGEGGIIADTFFG